MTLEKFCEEFVHVDDLYVRDKGLSIHGTKSRILAEENLRNSKVLSVGPRYADGTFYPQLEITIERSK